MAEWPLYSAQTFFSAHSNALSPHRCAVTNEKAPVQLFERRRRPPVMITGLCSHMCTIRLPRDAQGAFQQIDKNRVKPVFLFYFFFHPSRPPYYGRVVVKRRKEAGHTLLFSRWRRNSALGRHTRPKRDDKRERRAVFKHTTTRLLFIHGARRDGTEKRNGEIIEDVNEVSNTAGKDSIRPQSLRRVGKT